MVAQVNGVIRGCSQYATERNELKNRFIQLKATCKENISRISETQVQQEKNDSLSKLLERYREIRASFKDLGVDDYAQRSHRNELFKGRGLSKRRCAFVSVNSEKQRYPSRVW